jgi:hypothetical protein
MICTGERNARRDDSSIPANLRGAHELVSETFYYLLALRSAHNSVPRRQAYLESPEASQAEI